MFGEHKICICKLKPKTSQELHIYSPQGCGEKIMIHYRMNPNNLSRLNENKVFLRIILETDNASIFSIWNQIDKESLITGCNA